MKVIKTIILMIFLSGFIILAGGELKEPTPLGTFAQMAGAIICLLAASRLVSRQEKDWDLKDEDI